MPGQVCFVCVLCIHINSGARSKFVEITSKSRIVGYLGDTLTESQEQLLREMGG
jgi:hypothetical protein